MQFLAIDNLQSRCNAAVIAMQPLIKSYSWKASQRAHVLGIPLDMDDFVQELSLATVRCVERYDPEKGWTFEAFLRGAFHNEVSALIRRNQQGVRYGIYSVSAAHSDEMGESHSLFDQFSSGEGSPEEELEAQQLHEFIMDRLDQPGREFYGLLLDPPKEIHDQLERFNAGVLALRESGESKIRMAVLSDFNNTDWAVILGLPVSIIAQLQRQIHAAVEQYNRG
jgi:DNA-directed RNA polymerase specialized sigma24 family protein